MAAVNAYSFKGIVGINFFILGYKLLVMILIIMMLPLTHFYNANFVNLHLTLLSTTTWHQIFSAVAAGGIAFAFTGFKHGVELAGEATRKHITIPLAIIGSVFCCLALYVALQIVFIGAINPKELSHGWQTLSFTADAGPFAGILIALGIGWLLKLLYVDAAVSPLGAGFIYMTSTARITYSMAKNGYLFKIIGAVNRHHMPIGAIILNAVLGMLLFLPFSGWQAMVGFLVSVMVVAYGMGPLSLMALRQQLPATQRDFRLPLASIICPLSFYCCILISYWTGWETISKLAIISVIGIIVFFIALARGKLNQDHHLGLRSLQWFIPFIAGLTIISYLGNFGGKQYIPFGWDFVLLAAFTALIIYLAKGARLPANLAQRFANEAIQQSNEVD
jgi:amino acid transporter